MGKTVKMYVGLLGVLLGCGGDGDEDGPAGNSQACKDFQDAICDYSVDRCEQRDRESCDDLYEGVACKSDGAADACSAALDDAECSASLPEACSLSAVADPAPAIANCNRLVDVTCERVVECGQIATVERCQQEVMADPNYIDCADALSTSPRLERCLEELMDADCGAPLPPICSSVIHVE